jgi:hypothetical protein
MLVGGNLRHSKAEIGGLYWGDLVRQVSKSLMQLQAYLLLALPSLVNFPLFSLLMWKVLCVPAHSYHRPHHPLVLFIRLRSFDAVADSKVEGFIGWLQRP